MSDTSEEGEEEFNITDASVGIAEQPKTEEAEPVEEAPPAESAGILMPKPESQDTMIPIKKVTRTRLIEHKTGNDTYDSLINRLLDGWDNAHKPILGTGAEG